MTLHFYRGHGDGAPPLSVREGRLLLKPQLVALFVTFATDCEFQVALAAREGGDRCAATTSERGGLWACIAAYKSHLWLYLFLPRFSLQFSYITLSVCLFVSYLLMLIFII